MLLKLHLLYAVDPKFLPSIVTNMHRLLWKHPKLLAGHLKYGRVWLFDSNLSANEDTVKYLLKPKLMQDWPEASVKIADNGQLHPCVQILLLKLIL